MSLKMMAQVLAHVQRLGAEEDILSGLLAAALERDRTFAASFFHAMLSESGVKESEYFHTFPPEYGLITADKVSKKRYAWIEDKRIAFAPDIWIFDKSGEEWDEVKPKPKPSFHFLIECKEGARVTKGQARGYPFFEDDLFGASQPRVFTLLVYGEASDEEKKLFSHSVSWTKAAAVMRSSLASLADESVKADLLNVCELYEYHLAFDAEAQTTRSDEAAAEALLGWIRQRLPSEGTIEPRGNPSAKPLGKWLCLSSDQKLQLWLRAERKASVYALQIETWLEQSMTGKPIKFILSPDAGGCQELLNAIMAEQRKFADGLV